MAEVRVRDVDEGVIEELKARARRERTTLSDVIRGVLTDAAWRPRREWVERLSKLRESIREEHGVLPDSTPLIREERDLWG